MQGNYRRGNYLFAGSASKSSAGSVAAAAVQPHQSDAALTDLGQKNKQQQQQQQQSSGRMAQNQFNGHLSPTTFQQQRSMQHYLHCSNQPQQQRSASHNNNNSSSNESARNATYEAEVCRDGYDDCSQLDADHYALQLRNLSIQQTRDRTINANANQYFNQQTSQRFQATNMHQQSSSSSSTDPRDQSASLSQQQRWLNGPFRQQQHQDTSNQMYKDPSETPQSNSSKQQHQSNHMRVNFNRSNHRNEDDTDDNEQAGESRKKKYLTAKYGQQQMNLIKKRLKIETWLHEQLQELAKSINAESELDEIDIDLDQLLDMEDDETRQRWLKKTLQPFDRVPSNKLDKFICEVLEQSKLL